MFKKTLLVAAVAALAFQLQGSAQTNLQTFYDFGANRGHFTTTLEGFYGDSWGNTFFFIDYDFNAKDSNGVNQSVSGSYMEIARCLNFWQDSALAPLSLHVEYNGGVGFPSQNFLFGADYFLHSQDFSNTLNLKLLYKTFSGGTTSQLPLQFTVVCGMQDIFGVKGLRFSGFADIWGEDVVNFMEKDGLINPYDASSVVFISEPQIWYNVGQHFGVPNLNVGGEIELSLNFAGYKGFKARPCIGTKWVF